MPPHLTGPAPRATRQRRGVAVNPNRTYHSPGRSRARLFVIVNPFPAFPFRFCRRMREKTGGKQDGNRRKTGRISCSCPVFPNAESFHINGLRAVLLL